MGSPAIFAGKRSKLLSSKGLLYSNGAINDYNGDINYILNGHAEVNTTGWATYADAAQATPVDGTGGSPSVTWTQTTTSPLDDLGSFVFTKDAVNRQGQGVSYAFTIDSASQAKVMTITCDYIVGSGTFVAGASGVDSDLEVYIYDVTNSVLIQPSTYKLYSNSSTIASQFIANFQTPYNSTSYRLIFHCATTSASAYTVKFDNVQVSPTQYTYGTPITDWQDFPSVAAGTLITAVTTNPTYGTVAVNKAMWRRVGGNAEIVWTYRQTTAGTAGSGMYLFNIPASIGTIDTAKAPANTGTTVGTADAVVGTLTFGVTTTVFAATSDVSVYSTTQLKAVNLILVASVSGYNAAPWGTFAASQFNQSAGQNYTLRASVPILGWSSCVQMSDSTSQQVIAASYYCTANFAASTTTPINFDGKDFDLPGNGVTTSATAWKFTAQVPGVYSVSFGCNFVGSPTGNIILYKNGSSYKSLFMVLSGAPSSGTVEVNLNAGDYIDIRPSTSLSVVGGALNAQGVAIVSIQRISGPASIAATDTVACRYSTTAGNSVGTGLTTVTYATKDYDNIGAYNTSTGVWTAQSAGKYLVTITGDLDVVAGWSMRQTYQNAVTVNATTTYYVSRCWSQAAGSLGLSASGAVILNLKANDYFTIQHSSSIASTLTIAPAGMNNFCVNRLGAF